MSLNPLKIKDCKRRKCFESTSVENTLLFMWNNVILSRAIILIIGIYANSYIKTRTIAPLLEL